MLFMYYSIARSGIAATRVAKLPVSQGCHPRRIFLFHIYNIRCHMYLHAKFQKDLPKKQPKTFDLKIWDIVFGSDCTCDVVQSTIC